MSLSILFLSLSGGVSATDLSCMNRASNDAALKECDASAICQSHIWCKDYDLAQREYILTGCAEYPNNIIPGRGCDRQGLEALWYDCYGQLLAQCEQW
jgi:hypothetical protein